MPYRPISPHPNLVTESGLEALANALAESHALYNAAQQIEDAGERRRALTVVSREARYFADRLSTPQVVPPPVAFRAVAFGHKVTFKRDDGRLQAFRIIGEDEADPRNGSISYVSPVARALIGKAAATSSWWATARSRFSPSSRAESPGAKMLSSRRDSLDMDQERARRAACQSGGRYKGVDDKGRD